MTREGKARAAEVAVVLLTLVATLSAREPSAGASYRWVFAIACLAATAIVVWYSWHCAPTRGWVLSLAVALRLIAFPLPPTLSDDAYRYVWDGVVQSWGENPYHYRPDSRALAELHDEPVYDRLNSSRYYSVYPPASQVAFLLGAPAYGGGWSAAYYAIKAVIALAEVAAILLLLRLAAPAAVLPYAWSPLAVIEVAGQGHTEGLAVLGLVLAAWGVARRIRHGGAVAGAGLALAGGAKLLPLVLVPFAWRRAGWLVPATAAVACAALALPYAAPYTISHIGESLGLYVRSFEFAAGPYLLLKGMGAALGMGDVSKTLGPALAVAFAAGYAALVWIDRRKAPSFAAMAAATYALFLATATTVHPWYLVPALALTPLLRRTGPWLWASAFAPATYLFYTGPAWAYTTAVTVAWIGALAIGIREPAVDLLLRRRARWKWRWIESALLDPVAGTDVLDLGAAEGYVGACAARAGARVTLMDIADANRTSLPHRVFDGEHLPVATASVDTVLLVFVLHHARDPDRLISEARRVAKRYVVIVETTPEQRGRGRTEALDRLANRLRPRSLRDDERWLRMHPSSEWRRRFESAELEIVTESRRGGLVHPQTLFVTRPLRASSNGTPVAGATT